MRSLPQNYHWFFELQRSPTLLSFAFWPTAISSNWSFAFTETAFCISLLTVSSHQPCQNYPAITPHFSTPTSASTSHYSQIMAAKGQKFSFGRLINNMIPNFSKDDVISIFILLYLSLSLASLASLAPLTPKVPKAGHLSVLEYCR